MKKAFYIATKTDNPKVFGRSRILYEEDFEYEGINLVIHRNYKNSELYYISEKSTGMIVSNNTKVKSFSGHKRVADAIKMMKKNMADVGLEETKNIIKRIPTELSMRKYIEPLTIIKLRNLC